MPITTTATTESTTSLMDPLSHNGGAEAGADLVWGAVLSGAVMAALLTATVNLGLARRKSLEEERARLRGSFAEAFEVALRYKEMPYAIRRRRSDEPEAERVRLSNEMRDIQAKLAYHALWISGESETVGNAYRDLVTELRRVAGRACNEAWKADAPTEDQQMNIGADIVDLAVSVPYEQLYVSAVQKHLDDFMKFHRLLRPLRQKRTSPGAG